MAKVIDITETISEWFKDTLNSLTEISGQKPLTLHQGNGESSASKFYPLDKDIPRDLYPQVGNMLAKGVLGKELQAFIGEILFLQALNISSLLPDDESHKLTFYPGESSFYKSKPGMPLYAFIEEVEGEFVFRTETCYTVD